MSKEYFFPDKRWVSCIVYLVKMWFSSCVRLSFTISIKRKFSWRNAIIMSFFCIALVILLIDRLRIDEFKLTTKKWIPSSPPLPMELYEIMKLKSKPCNTSQFKKILYWNEAYGAKWYDIGVGSNVFRNANCSVWKCSTSDIRTPFNPQDVDAILFHQRSWYLIFFLVLNLLNINCSLRYILQVYTWYSKPTVTASTLRLLEHGIARLALY